MRARRGDRPAGRRRRRARAARPDEDGCSDGDDGQPVGSGLHAVGPFGFTWAITLSERSGRADTGRCGGQQTGVAKTTAAPPAPQGESVGLIRPRRIVDSLNGVASAQMGIDLAAHAMWLASLTLLSA